MSHETTTTPTRATDRPVESYLPANPSRADLVEAHALTRAAEANTRAAEAERGELAAAAVAAGLKNDRELGDLRRELSDARRAAQGYHDDFVNRVFEALGLHPGMNAGEADPVVNAIRRLVDSHDALNASKVTHAELAAALGIDLAEAVGLDLVDMVRKTHDTSRQKARELVQAQHAAGGYSRKVELNRQATVAIIKRLLGVEGDLTVKGVDDFDLVEVVTLLADDRDRRLAEANELTASLVAIRRDRDDAVAMVQTHVVRADEAVVEARKVLALELELERLGGTLTKAREAATSREAERDAAHEEVGQARRKLTELREAIETKIDQVGKLNQLAERYRLERDAATHSAASLEAIRREADASNVAAVEDLTACRLSLKTSITRADRAEQDVFEAGELARQKHQAYDTLAGQNEQLRREVDRAATQRKAAEERARASDSQAVADRIAARTASAEAAKLDDLTVAKNDALHERDEAVAEAAEQGRAFNEVRKGYTKLKGDVRTAVKSRFGARRRVLRILYYALDFNLPRRAE